MKSKDIYNFIVGLFDEGKLEASPGEYGFYDYCKADVTCIGYATNLTPQTIEAASKAGIQFILTHHDAWDFIFGMKEACMEELKKLGISCFFVHAPLDDAEFGTNASLVKALGFESKESFGNYMDLYTYGRVVDIESKLSFEELAGNVEQVLGEPVRAWKNNNKPVNKLAVVTGGGMLTTDMKLAYDLGCDTYITGEKVLYTIQYARFTGMNLIVGSHTFTEIFGVESLANVLCERLPGLTAIRLKEERVE